MEKYGNAEYNLPSCERQQSAMIMDARWNIVEPLFREHVIRHMSDPARAEAWIAALQKADAGMVLAASLCIDAVAQILDVSQVCAYLDATEPTDDPLRVFNQRTSTGLRNTPVCPGTYEHGGYVRIVELRTFVSRYLRRKVTPASVAEARNEYLGDSAPHPLGGIRRALRGEKGHTWVLPMKEFLDARNRENPASFLNDALGIGMECAYQTAEAAELLAIVYPATFDADHRGTVRQPNTFDAAWDYANFYISHINEDGWGRTHSCSHRYEPHHERVHDSLTALSDDFMLEWVGPAERPAKNLDLHKDEAVRRLLAAVAANT